MFENKSTEKKINRVLALGTVIYLSNSTDKLMIVSRQVMPDIDEDLTFDYCGCRLPKGLNPQKVIFFNVKDIGEVLFEGYSDDDEVRMEKLIQSKLDEDA